MHSQWSSGVLAALRHFIAGKSSHQFDFQYTRPIIPAIKANSD
jgi:hypothetical protein